jgi:hypothetical protein
VPRIVFSSGILGVAFRVFALAIFILLAGCHFQTDPPGDAPTGVKVIPGDGRVTISFDQLPGLTYWIFYQAGSSLDPSAPGVSIFRGAASPQVLSTIISGVFLNGTQYAFIMNATKNDSRAGPFSSTEVATPRLAGPNWDVGVALGPVPQNLNGLAFNNLTRLVAVGDSGTVFAGNYDYTHTNPPGVTEWLPPTSFPTGFVENLRAVTFSNQFVALGENGSILTSPDGSVWTLAPADNFVPSTGMNDLVFAFPRYVAVGNGGKIFTSPDLVVWTQPVSNTVEDLYSASLLNGRVVVTGANGTLLTSLDGVNWDPQQSNTGNALRGATFRASINVNDIQYVVVGDAGTIVTSVDGTTWTATTLANAPNLLSVTRGGALGTRFLAVGSGGAVAFSDDGAVWTQTTAGSSDLRRVLVTPGMYIAVGAAGANAVSK